MHDNNGIQSNTAGDLKPNEITSIFQYYSSILMNRIRDGDEIIALHACKAISPENLMFESGDRAIVLDRPSYVLWHVQRAEDAVTAFVDPEFFVSHAIFYHHGYGALISAAFCVIAVSSTTQEALKYLPKGEEIEVFTSGIALQPGNLVFHPGDVATVLGRLLSLWRITRKADGATGLVYPDYFVIFLILIFDINLAQRHPRNPDEKSLPICK